MLFWAAIAVALVAVVDLVSALIVGPGMWSSATEGRTALFEGASAVARRDAAAARVEFMAAKRSFDEVEAQISSTFAAPLRVTPVISRHVDVALTLARVGDQIADAGVAVANTMGDLPDQSLAFTRGRVDLATVRRAEIALTLASQLTPRIEDALAEMPSGWVSEPFDSARQQVLTTLPPIVEGVRKAEAAVEGLPSMLGEGGTKRYLIAFSNLSELRGSGGLFGFVTDLEATDGAISLGELSGRPTEIFPEPGEVGLSYPDWFPDDFRTQSEIFQNINMTTDFPTVGSFVLRTAEEEAGSFDGVLAVDPIGISGLLNLTGPVEIPAWPRPIDANNVAKIAMHDIYVSISNNATRDVFFEQLVRATFTKLTGTTVRLSPQTVGVLDGAARGGHLRMFSKHARDQSTFERIGVAGDLTRAEDSPDVLSLVSENATGNKMDWFLRREIRGRITLDPDANEARTELDVTFRNTAPPSGLPDYVIGGVVPGIPRGTNRQIVVVVRSANDRLDALTVDGAEATAAGEREAHLQSYRSTVEIPALGRSRLQMTSTTSDAMLGRGNDRVYRLRLMPQAVANPDFAEIEIEVPPGWRTAGQTRFLGDLDHDVVMEVRLVRTVRGSFVRSVFVEPVRLIGRFFGRLI